MLLNQTVSNPLQLIDRAIPLKQQIYRVNTGHCCGGHTNKKDVSGCARQYVAIQLTSEVQAVIDEIQLRLV